jgi:hypothetical protein
LSVDEFASARPLDVIVQIVDLFGFGHNPQSDSATDVVIGGQAHVFASPSADQAPSGRRVE